MIHMVETPEVLMQKNAERDKIIQKQQNSINEIRRYYSCMLKENQRRSLNPIQLRLILTIP